MFWEKYKKLIVIVIFFFVVGEVYFFVVKKVLSEIEAKRIRIQEEVAIQENQQKRMSDIQKLKEDFELVERTEGEVASFLDKNKAVDFIQEVEKLSEGTNSRVAIEVVPGELPARGKASSKDAGETIIGSLPVKDYLQLKIKTAGSFLGFIKFINQLENSKYYLDIVSLQINANTDSSANSNPNSQGRGNPFSSGSSPLEQEVQNSEEVVGSINVVVYTQAQ